ncbi:hypothetical protein UG55_103314 [Frankia sp. EI5c]|uniref:DUF5134 domain-containing protein n=1 Tax=Frankia sp. EI5c TaxID=683316 RepID=UPI0007C2D780|nr:DUF5134 domain-containing protein [Frankia sp. EI5c]OAA23872.1 hypothetical protein UG55_103314 [Frankia sp. EI5c]
MTHRHSAVELVPLPGPVAYLAGAASVVVAVIHLGRLRGTLRARRAAAPLAQAGGAGPASPARQGGGGGMAGAYGWIEVGHVLVAAGMAVMFTGPERVVGSWPFVAVYLTLAVSLLVVVVTHPQCGLPGVWSCCAMLVVEAAAMACMSGAVGFAGWPVGVDGAAGTWCVVLFAGACLVALVGLPARRAARSSARPLVARLMRVFPEPVVPRATRLIMSGGMVLMFLGQT